jgi:hypothetical protein
VIPWLIVCVYGIRALSPPIQLSIGQIGFSLSNPSMGEREGQRQWEEEREREIGPNKRLHWPATRERR